MKDETSDDAHSVGTIVTHGMFRLINLGDLSWNQECGLVCPTNRIGTVDVLLASQHGDDEAGSATFVHAIRPRVAVTNNGEEGGRPTDHPDASCLARHRRCVAASPVVSRHAGERGRAVHCQRRRS